MYPPSKWKQDLGYSYQYSQGKVWFVYQNTFWYFDLELWFCLWVFSTDRLSKQGFQMETNQSALKFGSLGYQYSKLFHLVQFHCNFVVNRDRMDQHPNEQMHYSSSCLLAKVKIRKLDSIRKSTWFRNPMTPIVIAQNTKKTAINTMVPFLSNLLPKTCTIEEKSWMWRILTAKRLCPGLKIVLL